jgi:hypothetical protein
MPDHQLPEGSLANEEWDFSGCPEDEIFDCWVYEFAREYHRRHGKIPGIWRIWFPIGADFPHTPYLNVSRANPSEEVIVNEEDRKRFSEYFEKHPETVSPSGDTFTINWQHSDRALVECFKRLLKDKRPRPPAQGKGRPKELGADLKRLGAFRLLKTANLSTTQAMDYSASHRKGAINIPLYVNHADWSKASATIENTMAGFLEEMAKLTKLKPL